MKKTFFYLLPIFLLFSAAKISAQKVSKSSGKYFLDKANLAAHFPLYKDFITLVPVYKIASSKIIHRFFDTSPTSPSGRYVALFRMPYDEKEPQAGDSGEVVIVDLMLGTEKTVATSRGWETQLGANVQWGATDSELYYNDVDINNWKAFAVKLNILSSKKQQLDGTVFMVSADGKRLASYNLISSRRAQGGYGVVFPDSLTPKNIGVPKNDGVYVTDAQTGKTKMIATIADIYEKTIPSIKIENPMQHEFYCF